MNRWIVFLVAFLSRICRSRASLQLEVAALRHQLAIYIERTWAANPTWGSPKIVLERRKLGIDVARSTVERYRPKDPRNPSPGWRTFFRLHAREFAAMDFFVVPMAELKVLFVLVILGHDRRRVLHFNVTQHPTAEWTAQPSGVSCSIRWSF